MNRPKQLIEELLNMADISLNDDEAWSLRVHNDGFYNRVLRQGSLGLGESYMDGWWECDQLDVFFAKLLRARLDERVRKNTSLIARILWENVINPQSRSRAFHIGSFHYDTGNDLFQRMLDARMNYSCGYWANADNLDQAQEAKLELICQKLDLQKGQRLLDIGCGWGGLAKYAAERYGVSVVGITVSKEQINLAQELCQGLPIEIRFQDYRELNEPFDHIVSVGMFEHVGSKNYRTYMETVHRCLNPEGLFLLHTIGEPSPNGFDPWLKKYIFPNAEVPSIDQVGRASGGLFTMEDWHNFGPDYVLTLMAWRENFETHWPELADDYGERFYRMWHYYLMATAGSFRARRKQLWQIVFSKQKPGGYRSIRM